MMPRAKNVEKCVWFRKVDPKFVQKESAGTPLSVEVAHRSAASLEENDASKNPGMHSTSYPAKSHSVSRSAAFKSSKVLWASGGSQAWRWSATG